MTDHATRRRVRRPRPLWMGAAVATAGLVGGTVGAVDLIDSAGTVGEPAERIAVVSERLRFPIDPFPTCEVFDNYGGFSKSGQSGGHQGVDIGADEGQAVYAVADGVLEEQLVDYPGSAAGHGWKLRAFHPVDGEMQFRYYHLADFAEGLTEGSVVVEGQVIGYVGDTGNATDGGHHLHFEVRVGSQPRYGSAPSVDPVPLLDIPSACNVY